MPMYEYECDHCGVFSALRKMSESNQSAICDACGCASERIISAPRLAILGKAQLSAHEMNERSAHEPKIARRSSCGCAGTHTCKTSSSSQADLANQRSANLQSTALQSRALQTTAQKKAANNGEGNMQPFQMQTKKTARPWMLGH